MWETVLPYVGKFGPEAVVTLFVMAMVFDRLITRGSHLRELANLKEENKRLQAALTKAEAQRDKLMGLAGDVTVGIVNAIPAARDSVS